MRHPRKAASNSVLAGTKTCTAGYMSRTKKKPCYRFDSRVSLRTGGRVTFIKRLETRMDAGFFFSKMQICPQMCPLRILGGSQMVAYFSRRYQHRK